MVSMSHDENGETLWNSDPRKEVRNILEKVQKANIFEFFDELNTNLQDLHQNNSHIGKSSAAAFVFEFIKQIVTHKYYIQDKEDFETKWNIFNDAYVRKECLDNTTWDEITKVECIQKSFGKESFTEDNNNLLGAPWRRGNDSFCKKGQQQWILPANASERVYNKCTQPTMQDTVTGIHILPNGGSVTMDECNLINFIPVCLNGVSQDVTVCIEEGTNTIVSSSYISGSGLQYSSSNIGIFADIMGDHCLV